MKQEKKTQMFLALTQLHRNITNNEKVAFYPLFKSFGFFTSQIADIKKAMLQMKLIQEKNGKLSWNSEKCLPNPMLVEGILHTIKETKKQERESEDVKIKIKVTPKEAEPIKTDNSVEKILKSILNAGVNPTIVIICSK